MKVVVVDDQKLVREGIVTLLQFNEEVEVIAQYDNGQTLLDGLSEVSPDIILLDLIHANYERYRYFEAAK
ncbi:response regulator [Pseudoalteromonas maricaloris]